MSSARFIIALAVVAAASSPRAGVAAIATNGMARYQVIIDRSPFGTVSAAGDAAVLPNFAERYTFAGLLPSPTTNQLLAVIHDSSRNRAELVGVGGTVGEVTIEKIDVAGEGSKVVIRKGIEIASLPLKKRETAIAGVPTAPPAPVAVANAMPRPPGPANQNIGSPPPQSAERTVIVPPRRRIPFRRGE